MKKYLAKSVGETHKIAAEFTKNIEGGDIIGLIGNLGGGKTTFVQGLAKSLNIKEPVTSPTFVILKEYRIGDQQPVTSNQGIKSLVHVDLYRTNNWSDATSAGIEDYLGKSNTVCLIEWAEKIKNHLPSKTKFIKFKFIDENTREISGDI